MTEENNLTMKRGSQLPTQAKPGATAQMKSEIERYREALAKMEAQWESATKQLNENVLHQQIEQLNKKLTENNQEMLRLKKENQVLRL